MNGDGQLMMMDGAPSFELIINMENNNLASIRATGTDKYLRTVAGKLDVTLGDKFDWEMIRI